MAKPQQADYHLFMAPVKNMVHPKKNTYGELVEHSKEMRHYHSILNLLHWDQETYMPSGAIHLRSEQISLLSTDLHDLKTSRHWKQLLSKFVHLGTGRVKVKGLSRAQLTNLREWHVDYCKATKLPRSFVKTFAQLTSEASQIWAIAKKENQFKLFAPFLEKIIRLNREKADILGFGDHPYDALLEAYEPCMTSAKVGRLFDGLQKELTHLLGKIQKKPRVSAPFLSKSIDDETQRNVGDWLLSKLPIDPAYSRLDLSSHPFSMALHPRDSRITTRLLPNSFLSNIFSVLHEAGHSMYEMGLPMDQWGTPLCEAVSLTVHESQSRWWETLIGRSFPFWKKHYLELQDKVPHLKKIPLEKFYRAMHTVAPTFIRVEADEVTYGLHVILRFEIEKALISGTLSVADLPEAWNEKSQKLLGITPPNPAQGCLQDIHWSLGDFGYFPTYALGNLLAAQFFAAFAKDHPEWEEQVAKGNLGFIRAWLTDKVAHRITGKALSESAYCRYLKKKYGEIYEL
jgi:carboxypeptidase Taq